ncbi:MAG: glycosyltransferase [Fimbriimonadaceae bacterium]|nr:glycosyltransferase [Fimbriimonadaceae bacterium]
MRILHVITSMDPVHGGPANWTLSASRELNRLGHESEILTVDDPHAAFLSDLDVKVHAVGPTGRFRYSSNVEPWIREHRDEYDFVVLHAIFEPCCYATWRALRGHHHRMVTFLHGFLDPYFNRAFPLKMVKKYMFWYWAIYPQVRDAVVTLFTTEEERVLARQSFWPYRCNERVIAYGISKPEYDLDAARAAFFAKVPEAQGRNFLLYLSRIHPKKGVDLLVQAFARLAATQPDALLVVAGPDPVGIVPGLKDRAQALGVGDRIIWPGMLTGDAKWGAFETCEAFVLPSHQENFGQVVAEAMSCGKPVLISDKVNIHQEVSSTGSGLVASDDQAGTDSLLERFSAMSADEKTAMGQSAVKCFHDKFELEQSVLDFIRVLEEARDLRKSA